MASIRVRPMKDGTLSYHVMIRKKNQPELCQSFICKDDAELWAWYKERLIDNMEAFDVPLGKRTSLKDIIEIKIKAITDRRTLGEFQLCYLRIMENIKKHVFLDELSIDDWKECLENLSRIEVPAKSKALTKITLSLNSLRRIFATISSAFSHAISLGIEIENFPLKILQLYLTSKLNGEKNGND